MSDVNETLANLAKMSDIITKANSIDYSKFANYTPVVPKLDIPKIEIDEESTFAYQMKKHTDELIGKYDEQLELMQAQNKQLAEHYDKLVDLYNLKEKELEEAKKEAKKAKAFNIVMLIISIVSMITAVAAWLMPNILGGSL